MILKRYKRIYVLCPAFYKTGGTELLHQLVFTLNQMQIDSHVVYVNKTVDNVYLNPEFSEYVKNYKMLNDVEDDSDNLLIFPETLTQFSRRYKKIDKALWWLSVDNYLVRFKLGIMINHYGLFRALKYTVFNILKPIIKHDINYLPMRQLKKIDIHMTQSEYAKYFLYRNGIKNVYSLTDYLNDKFFSNQKNVPKENIVLYNPKKGYKFTNQIIKSNPNIKFVAIQNMSTLEVRSLLLKAKVYIDFGHHPGKDRFPREAAVSNCCIITGRSGSSDFSDVDIPDSFKFYPKRKNIEKISNSIENCINDFEKNIQYFQKYRAKIVKEKEQFIDEVEYLFTE